MPLDFQLVFRSTLVGLIGLQLPNQAGGAYFPKVFY